MLVHWEIRAYGFPVNTGLFCCNKTNGQREISDSFLSVPFFMPSWSVISKVRTQLNASRSERSLIRRVCRQSNSRTQKSIPTRVCTLLPVSCAERHIRSKDTTSSRSHSVQLVPQTDPTENNETKPLPLYVWKTRKTASLPVAQERAQQHQAVLHAGDDLRGAVSPQEEFSTGLEAAECQRFVVPLVDHLFQLLFNVSLLHCADADVLATREALIYSGKATRLIDSLSPEEPLLAISRVFKACFQYQIQCHKWCDCVHVRRRRG